MMITHEVVVDEQENEKAALFERLDQFTQLTHEYPGEPTYLAQVYEHERWRHEAYAKPELALQLVEYAARPGGSLLVRSFALDIAIGASRRAIENPEWYAAGEPTEAQQAIYEKTRQLIPEYWEQSADELNRTGETIGYTGKHLWFFQELARSEGLDARVIDPDPMHLGCDPTLVSTNVPASVSLLLTRLTGGAGARDLDYLSPGVSKEALELVLDFGSDSYRAAESDPNHAVTAEYAQLWRLTRAGGFEHDGPIDFLYSLPEQDRLGYARTFNRLYDAQELLVDYFPGFGVKNAAQALVAQALFAVENHVRGGMQTDEVIGLARKGEQSAKFMGDEPIRLLNELADRLEHGHERIMQSTPEVYKDTPEFTIFDFPPVDPDDTMQLAHYIRPEGSHNCNYRFEYGGNKPGVRASIDWRFDEGLQDSPRPHHKDSRTEEAFSIRLDRDPLVIGDQSWDVTKDDGAVTLDLGSILGTGFGRDIALLFATGNKLRAEAIGGEASFNHQTDQLDQKMGKASVFVGYAEARRTRLKAAAGYELSEPLRFAAATAVAVS